MLLALVIILFDFLAPPLYLWHFCLLIGSQGSNSQAD